ncbi:signal peptidase II [Guptibacillus hwajinpoensis]|uniref:signal peptidase II n=1 Tax=Guptibacillus hwajinpoensis TaxID=208199 RepID=UPI0024B3C7CB|nr:signal peptidase II [Pseudalkalibacillus hwajinpoensis]
MITMVTILLVMDLVTKRWIDSILNLNEQIDVINGFLTLQLYYNTGATRGLLEGYTGLLIFLQASIVLLLIYGYIRATPKRFAVQLAFGLLIGGGLGNLIDRIQYGYVIDFMKVSEGIFNLADMEIRYGFILILVLYFMKKFTIQGFDDQEK